MPSHEYAPDFNYYVYLVFKVKRLSTFFLYNYYTYHSRFEYNLPYNSVDAETRRKYAYFMYTVTYDVANFMWSDI